MRQRRRGQNTSILKFNRENGKKANLKTSISKENKRYFT